MKRIGSSNLRISTRMIRYVLSFGNTKGMLHNKKYRGWFMAIIQWIWKIKRGRNRNGLWWIIYGMDWMPPLINIVLVSEFLNSTNNKGVWVVLFKFTEASLALWLVVTTKTYNCVKDDIQHIKVIIYCLLLSAWFIYFQH